MYTFSKTVYLLRYTGRRISSKTLARDHLPHQLDPPDLFNTTLLAQYRP